MKVDSRPSERPNNPAPVHPASTTPPIPTRARQHHVQTIPRWTTNPATRQHQIHADLRRGRRSRPDEGDSPYPPAPSPCTTRQRCIQNRRAPTLYRLIYTIHAHAIIPRTITDIPLTITDISLTYNYNPVRATTVPLTLNCCTPLSNTPYTLLLYRVCATTVTCTQL